jgi:large subunit ribosomal protein L25
MQVTMRELDVSCLPADIPEQLEINVEDLGIGDSIHVRDVSVPKAEILSPERRTIVVIAAPTVIKAEAAAAVEEEAEEAEVAEGEEAPAETEESSEQSETK